VRDEALLPTAVSTGDNITIHDKTVCALQMYHVTVNYAATKHCTLISSQSSGEDISPHLNHMMPVTSIHFSYVSGSTSNCLLLFPAQIVTKQRKMHRNMTTEQH